MKKRVTSKSIGKAIEKTYGIPFVEVVNGGGYQYFSSDNDVVGAFLMAHTTSVYIFRMSDWSIEEWVDEFGKMIADADWEDIRELEMELGIIA